MTEELEAIQAAFWAQPRHTFGLFLALVGAFGCGFFTCILVRSLMDLSKEE